MGREFLEDRVFVLRTFKHSESDLIVHALNTKGAKLQLFARSAVKSKKRFGGGALEPTQYLKIQYRPAKSDEGLSDLMDAVIIKSFSGLREDYDRIEVALEIVSLIEKVSFVSLEGSEDLFNLLGNALDSLQNSISPRRLLVQFRIKLLHQQGVLPTDLNFESFMLKSIRDSDSLDLDSKSLERIVQQTKHLLDVYIGQRVL